MANNSKKGKMNVITIQDMLDRRRTIAAQGSKYQANQRRRHKNLNMNILVMLITINKLAAHQKQINVLKRTYKNQSILLWIGYTKTIKGKSGLNMNTKDGIFLKASEAIAEALTLNTSGFYSPQFTGLALLNDRNTILDTSIRNVARKVLGCGGAKMKAKKDVMKSLRSAVNFINKLAANDQKNAAEIITGAKMLVIGNYVTNKQDIKAKQGNRQGEIKLRCPAEKDEKGKYMRATYYWQYSITINGKKVWIDLDATSIAETIATGMTRDVWTHFRKRTKKRVNGEDVYSKWSAFVSIIPVK